GAGHRRPGGRGHAAEAHRRDRRDEPGDRGRPGVRLHDPSHPRRGHGRAPARLIAPLLDSRPPMAKRTSAFGRLYRGREGQWSWIAHRVTGVAIILFLFAHIVDTALVGWGPHAYNRVVSVYKNTIVGLLELGLVAAVIYHALNGLRIMAIDFWPKLVEKNRQLIYGTMTIYVLGMAPIAAIMIRHILKEHF